MPYSDVTYVISRSAARANNGRFIYDAPCTALMMANTSLTALHFSLRSSVTDALPPILAIFFSISECAFSPHYSHYFHTLAIYYFQRWMSQIYGVMRIGTFVIRVYKVSFYYIFGAIYIGTALLPYYRTIRYLGPAAAASWDTEIHHVIQAGEDDA